MDNIHISTFTRDYIAICRGKLSISRFFAEKRRFRDLSRKIANFAISTPPRQTNAPGSGEVEDPDPGLQLRPGIQDITNEEKGKSVDRG